ncbi:MULTISPECIES: GTP cyclohydrolase II [unclassified Paracoccus (in: a-proteobacteria)]|uniref:GTP cyclohydrolase II n=1 Tax=unclassified Paracoccus (in: a-proteobacteria) TaxID=2688777 RepID=UPI0021E12C5F|nr:MULTISPECIES: GTP cyclohydrolase II [unclassified Paracoccus (in: a-proteobacteria)]UXU75509.1 GTP cyclohydrolase II [Paracoccus sp. SMMA_5]UXU81414.1 GTP cyclohydrolase II [Paracoccus sp. SMMA_5_TC]
MSLIPTLIETLSRARADLRMGLPVVIADQLVAAVETLRPERLAAMRALGPAVLAITQPRAETLKARVYDGDLARIEMPTDADVTWLRAVADPAGDLMTPLKGPFRSPRGGDVAPHRAAIALAKSAQLLPAVLMVAVAQPPAELTRLAPGPALAQMAAEAAMAPVAAARLPLMAAEDARLHIFRPDTGEAEHYAVEIGAPSRQAPVLARLHSACFTGDVLGSLKCDCGPQLQAALAAMGANGSGVLLYLNQEGRGIGLANKMRAYALQNQGFDTVEANHRLGFQDDERDFRIGAGILKRMGFASVRLMTNNPRKVAMLQGQGIEVAERVPLITPRNRHNTGYLDIKAQKSGHLL